MDVRNATWADQDQTVIIAEVDHPERGWLECALRADDPLTATMFEQAVATGVARYVAPPGSREQVKAERLRRLEAGRAFNVEGLEKPVLVTGRSSDQTTLLGLLARAEGFKAAGVTGPVITYRDGTNTIYKLTPEQLIELVAKGMAFFEAVMDASWTMLDSNEIPADFANDKWWPA